ncbi:heat shock factor binding protein 1-domain-containing protein [Auriculariales sp. MPI-PUGE-AT-0066]|nr:heat shock factor binding protein 1-domain-containing protein [Auriculariales sp. MPI-PUGE-AT-0066]
MSAAPLKVTAGAGPSSTPTQSKPGTPKPPQSASNSSSTVPPTKPEDISSPHELTAFVEMLLGQLETKFDDMSNQLLERMNQMSSRVDSLEASIQDLINADIAVPPSVPGTPRP